MGSGQSRSDQSVTAKKTEATGEVRSQGATYFILSFKEDKIKVRCYLSS